MTVTPLFPTGADLRGFCLPAAGTLQTGGQESSGREDLDVVIGKEFRSGKILWKMWFNSYLENVVCEKWCEKLVFIVVCVMGL